MIRVDRRSLLLGPTIRRIPWVALGSAFAASAVVVWGRALQVDTAADLIPVIRIGSVLFAAAAATSLEDPNQAVLDATPVGRPRRRLLTVVPVGAAVVMAWLIIVLGARLMIGPPSGRRLPIGGLALELVAACAIGWLFASTLIAGTTWRGTGTRAAAGVIVCALVSLGHPRVIGWLWVMPGPRWQSAHQHWAIVALAAIALCGLYGRDPATRSIHHRGVVT